jgi:c-di-GMP-binding flagellar brake protein YcgR
MELLELAREPDSAAESGKVLKRYSSKLEKFLSEDKVAVYRPMRQSIYAALDKSKKYETFFYTESGPIKYAAKFLKYEKASAHGGNGVELAVLRLLDKGERIQRRQYFRLPVSLEALFRSGDRAFAGAIKDISGGGVRFFTNGDLSSATAIFNLNEEELSLTLKILEKIAVDKAVSAGVYNYEYRSMFVDIDEKTREKILKYVFEAQSKRR